MLEDIVLSEMMRACGREADPIMGTSVFNLAFPRGEFDMGSVLYRGKPFRAEDGVCRQNVEEFLWMCSRLS